MRLTVVADNRTCRDDLTIQHGLCFWIEQKDHQVLFDTGSDASWLQNAERLGVDPLSADMLFISHGHWDHGGGLPALVERGWQGVLVAHPGAWQRKRAVKSGEAERNTGLTWSSTEIEKLGVQVEAVSEPGPLFDGAWTTGPIPGEHPTPAALGLQAYIDGAWQPEDFLDEQTLVLETAKGLVVVTGCCHRGVLNTLDAVKASTGRHDIYALIGGLHQKDEPRENCLQLARELRNAGIQKVWANHCTGLHPFAQMREILGDDLVWAEAGTIIQIED